MRYVHNERQWRIWDGKRWVTDVTGEIDRIAIDTVRNMAKEAAEITDENRRRDHLKWALSSENRARRENMIACARHQREVAATTEHFDANRMLLNVLNGTIDLKTGELWPHKRENLLSKQAPVEFRPHAECTLWRKFLDEIFMGDVETISFIQRAAGYSLTGDISEQCLFLLLGNGNNGKGVFLKTLSSLMGDYTASANFDTFTAHKNERSGPRDGVADLVGARFVRASESEEGNRLSEAKLKGLVAPDGRIRGCRLYQESFEFYPQHKIWLATNHEPAIRGTDEGIWRRIRRVPFNYSVPPDKRIPDLEEKLKPELSGILNWALEGLRNWRSSGLGTSKSVLEATADYRVSQNSTKRFFDECVVKAKPEQYARSEEVYLAFKIWCEKTGEYQLKQTKFGIEFVKLAPRGKDSDGRRAYFGIQLRD